MKQNIAIIIVLQSSSRLSVCLEADILNMLSINN